MTDQQDLAFEGPEKLLEIWFYPEKSKVPQAERSLRSISHERWKELLELVKCEVLSVVQTKDIDCFLLSESSMFVFDHKLLLKTCGTTTTLLCLSRLFELIKEELGWDFSCSELGTGQKPKNNPYKVFYSRRAFMFPENQRSIHRNWNDEVNYLNGFFINGSSYVIGRVEQNDHWNLYVTKTNTELCAEDETASQEDDVTLEILMTGLDPSRAQKFVLNSIDSLPSPSDGHDIGASMTSRAKIDQIYNFDKSKTSFHQDSFGFEPCGYSCNMALDESYYYTIHVTPEHDWSYASFESNVLLDKLGNHSSQVDVVNNVLSIFQPLDFCLTVFIKTGQTSLTDLDFPAGSLLSYKQEDKIIHELDDYQLIYLRYSKI